MNTLRQPVFIAVFPVKQWQYVRTVDKNKGVLDRIVNVAYDDTGQRWGFVERITAGTPHWAKEYRPEKRVARGWVKLPTQILDEEWGESP